VAPKSFPDERAFAMASGANDLVANAQVVSSLQEAITGCELVLGTSARQRELEIPLLLPREAAEQTVEALPSINAVAFIFGREHAGLTNSELLACNKHIIIPSNPEYSSLNLAAAVQIIAYELRMAYLNLSQAAAAFQRAAPATGRHCLASAEEMELFYQHLQDVLVKSQFLDINNPRKVMPRLRRLFNRAQLERVEINILRGVFKNILTRIKR